MLTQIYEIQTPEEAEAMIELGVEHIGSVILSADDCRQPELLDTVNAIRDSSSKSSIIPLFVDFEVICNVIDYYRPDILHFSDCLCDSSGILPVCENHLELQSKVRDKYPGLAVMRAIPVAQAGRGRFLPSLEVAKLFEPISDYFLLDTCIVADNAEAQSDQPSGEGFIGITGLASDWTTARCVVQQSRIPVILAGGLSPSNVQRAIHEVMPAGVDSCMQTNARDANDKPIRFQKCMDRTRQFVENVRHASRQA
ncbi:N-(5'phosphoribosyl)anthranilate (PRA) isomerasefamily protein [Synechococcus sp. BIOS-E4-1]|uniref:phosphoribosylanthranilate isomerase n=1 Tax=Synechococcus sp. BIOS-E4-1 TaxID=1400864 RepID=UPI00164497BE|nr:hypothetical protein [Synechococcus sp. BIOS-E4-1]QNI55597.1 N-(5'phosphoribosyl)anthranilate (PRA) isomerasefamily protein [Synechococcus sp. BIOS-E4-1]